MSIYAKCFTSSSRLSASRHDTDLHDVGFLVDGETITASSHTLSTASLPMKNLFKYEINLNSISVTDGAITRRGFKAMIDFIYKEGNYSITDLLSGKEEVSLSDELAVVMELLYVGDIYLINSLVIFCRNILINKIRITRSNMKSMFDVMRNFVVLNDAYQIVTAQIKEVENAIVDILLFNNLSEGGTCRAGGQKKDYEIKFKVNQSALLVFDIDKQMTLFDDNCQGHRNHESQYGIISWEPENGRKETVGGLGINGAKFYAQANVKITLGLYMLCDGFGTHEFNHFRHILPQNGKFALEDLEVEVIEVNGRSYDEAIEAQEYIPLAVLSFQSLARVI